MLFQASAGLSGLRPGAVISIQPLGAAPYYYF